MLWEKKRLTTRGVGKCLFLMIFAIAICAPSGTRAYERVFWNEGTGYATSTGQNMVWSNTNTGIYWIDCNALGISEVASTTVSLYTSSGTNNDFWLVDLQSGRKSDAKYNISSSLTDYSYTFTPPIWCKDSTLQLMGYSSISTAVNFGSKGADNVDAVPHAWCYDSSGTGCNSMGNVWGMDIAIIGVGSYATSSESGGAGTTTNNYYLSVSTTTNATAEAISFWSAVVITLLVGGMITFLMLF